MLYSHYPLNNIVNKHNKIKSRAFNPTYTANVEEPGTKTNIWIRQWGAVVHVHYYIKLKTSCNKTYTDYQIATGLPPALYSGHGGAVCIDNEKADSFTEIGTDGILFLKARYTNMAGKIFIGGFTYIAQNDTW